MIGGAWGPAGTLVCSCHQETDHTGCMLSASVSSPADHHHWKSTWPTCPCRWEKCRFSKWMQHVEDDPVRRRMMEYELVRKCMPRDVDHVRCHITQHIFVILSLHRCLLGVPMTARAGNAHPEQRLEESMNMQANFIQHQGYTIVYRRYASLFFIVGIDSAPPYATSTFVLVFCMPETTCEGSQDPTCRYFCWRVCICWLQQPVVSLCYRAQ
jgi:hypothetical protein